MPYEYLDDVATADVALLARGRTLPEVFEAAADATMNLMVEDLGTIVPREQRELRLESDELELLLFDLLQELIYFKDAEELLLRVRDAQIRSEEGRHTLHAVAAGERLDTRRHTPRVDVKAVTLHLLRVEQTAAGWEAQVILDI